MNINGAVEAINKIDGLEPADWDEFCQSVQFLIDHEVVQHLEGRFHRLAKNMIEEGYCHEKE